jgi:hypothetical protein
VTVGTIESGHAVEWVTSSIECCGRCGSRRVGDGAGASLAGTSHKPDAHKKKPGGISGTVRAASGHAGLRGVCVKASKGAVHRQATSSKSGAYHLTNLPAGRYTVSFTPTCGNTGNFIGGTAPKKIVVKAGKTTKKVLESLTTGGAIAGAVVDSSGPVAGLCVTAARSGLSRSTTTGKAGSYTIDRLTSGTYTLTVAGCGTTASAGYQKVVTSGVVVHLGRTARHGSTTVTTGGGGTTATITGTVTSAGPGHQPLDGACVLAHGPIQTTVYTAANGTYALNGLPPGTYTIDLEGFPLLGCTSASDPWGYGYVALNVTVTAGQTLTAQNGALTPDGAISGTVTGSSANATTHGPLDDICVGVDGSSGEKYPTDSDGNYLITGLAPGTYDVQFQANNCGNTDPYPFAEFDTNDGTPSIVVTAEHITTGVDAALTADSDISGTVTDSGSSAPLSGICVIITGLHYYTGGGAYTNSGDDGTYSFLGLPFDTYTISFQSPRPIGDGSFSCGTAGSPGTYPLQGAQTLTVSPEATNTVNAALTAS